MQPLGAAVGGLIDVSFDLDQSLLAQRTGLRADRFANLRPILAKTPNDPPNDGGGGKTGQK